MNHSSLSFAYKVTSLSGMIRLGTERQMKNVSIPNK